MKHTTHLHKISKPAGNLLFLLTMISGITVVLNWTVQSGSSAMPYKSANIANFLLGNGDDDTDLLEQGWGICEEIVDLGFCFQDNPNHPNLPSSCYGGNIGEVVASTDVAKFGSSSLRVWANKNNTLKSNHVIAQKRVSTAGYNGTRRYELYTYIDPTSGGQGQTGPEFSMQNTREVSPGIFKTTTAGIQYRANPFDQPGTWAVWTETETPGVAGWKEFITAQQPVLFDTGVWYYMAVEADFITNEYVRFWLQGNGIDLSIDLSAHKIVQENKFSEEVLWLTLESENLFNNCGAPEAGIFRYKVYYDHAVASFVVTNTSDNGPGSLRDAMQVANANPGLDKIIFNISGNGPHTIQPLSPLPAITDPVIIDGTSQSGYAGTPIIELDGASAGADGLSILAANCTVRGLAINRFGDDGISLASSASNNKIQANFIGTNVSGNQALANSSDGIEIRGANNTIGGPNPGEGNLISGNGLRGICIFPGTATGNVVQGNRIGTEVNGIAALGNAAEGILITDAANNTIGGTIFGAGNVISGNVSSGVTLFGAATGNQIQGNLIGTDATGQADLGNSFAGVQLVNASNNTIGGIVAEARNIISGNTWVGVLVQGSGATGNLVQGNFIGTDVNGIADLGNSQDGVLIFGAPGNTIGGVAPEAGNLISGNDSEGVVIEGANATGNIIRKNFIGTTRTGDQGLRNTSFGVLIKDSHDNTVGGTGGNVGNLIAFNGNRGIVIMGGAGNAILSNSIYANAGLGIDLASDGLTANDNGDADNGANNLQNFPVLTSIKYSAGDVTIEGTLNSTTNTTFRIELFANSVCDATGFGEGETFLGFTTVTTDNTGSQTFKATFPAGGAFGQSVSATATGPGNNTSEFSQCDLVIPLVDTDGDGIIDEVDTQPGTFSDQLSDVGLGGTTTGTITDRGDQILTISEEPNPGGVRVTVDPVGGATPATVSACGGASAFELTAGDEMVVTCGSVLVEVIRSTIAMRFIADDATEARVEVAENNTLKFEPTTGTFTVPQTNADPIIVIVEGEEILLAPGKIVSIKPKERLASVIDELNDIVLANPGTALAKKIVNAAKKLESALDELSKTPPDNQAALVKIKVGVEHLAAAVKDGLFVPEQVGKDFMDRLAGIARQLAVQAIDEAIAHHGDPNKINVAQQLLTEGDQLRALGKHKDAVNKYKDALAKAEQANPRPGKERAETSGDERAANLPKSFALQQNYPNPFLSEAKSPANGGGNPETEIRFQLPEASHVVVKVFNTIGEEIRTLVDAPYQAGYHQVHWDGKNKNGNPVSSGVYLYQFHAGSFSQVRKMSLLQ